MPGGFGPLIADPKGRIDLPEGFTYRVVSRMGQLMADGLSVPGRQDGMCAFPGPDADTCILICNHEIENEWVHYSPFGKQGQRLLRINRFLAYDVHGERPAIGGTTTMIYDLKKQRLKGQFQSLVGTVRNCAGGPTPWGTWLTCEEDVSRPGDGGCGEYHGYVFEVPPYTNVRLTKAVPIKAMGRFLREAVCVDPRTGIVYQTEDREDGLIYRYVPKEPGNLLAGGRTQALALQDRKQADTRNWPFLPSADHIEVGEKRVVRWVDLEDVDPKEDVLRAHGVSAGAARFARGEGMVWANDAGGGAAYFICTMGGTIGKGQVWRYRPSEHEGTAQEAASPGILELFAEPNDLDVINMPDNVCAAPWGDLMVCTDNEEGHDYLAGITPKGEFYKFAYNRKTESEFAGVCFSPDGSTLFFNLQDEAMTLAVTGPWSKRM